MPRKSRQQPNATKGKPKKKRPPHRGEAERIAARRVVVLQLRRDGLTYRAIAAKVKASLETVHSDVQAELEALRVKTGDLTQQCRDLEALRLDAAWAAVWPKAKKGDAPAVNAAMRISERRAKLLGLDAPTKIETFDRDRPFEQLDDAALEQEIAATEQRIAEAQAREAASSSAGATT